MLVGVVLRASGCAPVVFQWCGCVFEVNFSWVHSSVGADDCRTLDSTEAMEPAMGYMRRASRPGHFTLLSRTSEAAKAECSGGIPVLFFLVSRRCFGGGPVESLVRTSTNLKAIYMSS